MPDEEVLPAPSRATLLDWARILREQVPTSYEVAIRLAEERMHARRRNEHEAMMATMNPDLETVIEAERRRLLSTPSGRTAAAQVRHRNNLAYLRFLVGQIINEREENAITTH